MPFTQMLASYPNVRVSTTRNLGERFGYNSMYVFEKNKQRMMLLEVSYTSATCNSVETRYRD